MLVISTHRNKSKSFRFLSLWIKHQINVINLQDKTEVTTLDTSEERLSSRNTRRTPKGRSEHVNAT